ncbi:cAMP-binding domain of CRP or a regulatory subunit of cAMP-dependent protein kinases [Methylobacterium phyllostachyos]|uniref:cAMP-binding domain of CRP or a regulatory subunit of cAMP-dependent protein kinases n=1 Tax=Methylobacterium phyllostachyos TaxID=582672 RepID=A0A1G9VYP1_9HYPH|nr:Crp/Fnr family transcriptional regulator [Methylobacterium phyllostachyos]SDM77360.1 cAMP-binding domain of CRP or a regulatory subunit of cAMP-dependent protein kinases [Methylobacterium phyllostachyos]
MKSDDTSVMEMFLGKLERVSDLGEEDRAALLALPYTIRRFGAREDIFSYGEKPAYCCLVLDGWVHRYGIIGDGDRQILLFYIPGDVPDLQHLFLPMLDHTLASITASTLAFIPHRALYGLVERRPRVMAALWRDTLIDTSMYRERVMCLGRRSSIGRTAHFFCEMYLRQELAGLAGDLRCSIPITQGEIADVLGITPVHLNRSLRALRSRQVIDLNGGYLTILDRAALIKTAEFDPTYLHMGADLKSDLISTRKVLVS